MQGFVAISAEQLDVLQCLMSLCCLMYPTKTFCLFLVFY